MKINYFKWLTNSVSQHKAELYIYEFVFRYYIFLTIRQCHLSGDPPTQS